MNQEQEFHKNYFSWLLSKASEKLKILMATFFMIMKKILESGIKFNSLPLIEHLHI